jgi:chaperonin GroES
VSDLNPLGDWVLAKLPKKEAETKTSFGLIITEDADVEDALPTAEVVSVGPGGTDINGNRFPMDVEVGDILTYAQHNGVKHKIDNEDYLFLNVRAGYVLAVTKGGN